MIPDDLVPRGSTWPIVLGIDPGTRVMGYGALVVAPDGPRFLACGVLRPPARAPISTRLGEILRDLERLLAALRPATLALERAFHAKNAQAALRLGEARGVVLASAARAGVDVVELAPAAAKKAVLGHGGASKLQVARMIAQLLGVAALDVPGDATDALALAYASLVRSGPAARATLAARRADASNGRDGHAGEEGRRARTLGRAR